MFEIRHFYLQPQWWIPAKVKVTKKERQTEQSLISDSSTHINQLRSLSSLLNVAIRGEQSGVTVIVGLCKYL